MEKIPICFVRNNWNYYSLATIFASVEDFDFVTPFFINTSDLDNHNFVDGTIFCFSFNSIYYETYKKREEILNFEKNNYKSAELNFLRTKELYELGQASSLDLRQAQINLSAQEIRIIEAELDYELSKIELSLLVGRKLF